MKPALSPIIAPDLVCITCGAPMRRVIHTQQSNGKLDKIVYHCDTEKCRYAVSITKEHMSAQDDKYEALPGLKQAEEQFTAPLHDSKPVPVPSVEDEMDVAVIPANIKVE